MARSTSRTTTPRTDVEDYEHLVQTGKREPARVVTAVYELSNDEVAEVEGQFGAGVFVNRQARLSRGYEKQTYFNINLDENIAVQHLVAEAELPDDVRANAAQVSTLKELLATLSAAAGKQGEAQKAALAAAEQLEDVGEKAKAMDDANRLKESASSKQLRSDISTYLKKGSFKEYVWSTYLTPHAPEILILRRVLPDGGSDKHTEVKGTAGCWIAYRIRPADVGTHRTRSP